MPEAPVPIAVQPVDHPHRLRVRAEALSQAFLATRAEYARATRALADRLEIQPDSATTLATAMQEAEAGMAVDACRRRYKMALETAAVATYLCRAAEAGMVRKLEGRSQESEERSKPC